MTDPLPPTMFGPLYSSAAMRAAVTDRARLQHMLDFEAALARAEAAVGVIPASTIGPIEDACDAGRYDIATLAEAAVPASNIAIPMVNALTAEVAKRNAQAAGYINWGATSQDIIDTAMVLELRAAIDVLLADLDRATKAFTALAGRHRRTMTVARTLMQQAVPMPFGLKLAGYAAALGRSRERLRRLRKEALVLQFGGAAGTLAALGERGLDVSERLAALLDLPLPEAPWHTHRDRLAEVASALAILAGTCGKIARDVALLMQTEVAEAFEPAAPGRGGSSTLPHKRNPIAATAALAAATMAPNLANTILIAQIHEHERAAGAWQAEWVTFPALALVVSGGLNAIVDIAEGLEVDVARMKANLEASGGRVMSEAISFALAEKIGKAEAHHLVQELALRADKEQRPLKDLMAADARITAHLDAAALARLLLPTSYLGTSQTFIDRLVASASGRAVRRPPEPKPRIEPKIMAVAVPEAARTAEPAVEPAKPAPPPASESSSIAAAMSAFNAATAAVVAVAATTPEPKAEVAADTKPEPVPEQKAEAVPEQNPEPVPEPKVEPEPAPVAAQEQARIPMADAPPLRPTSEPEPGPEPEAPGALLEVFGRLASSDDENKV